MDRVKLLSIMTIITTSTAIMAEPPSSYGAPSFSSGFNSFRNSFRGGSNSGGGYPSTSSFSGGIRGTDAASLAASIPGPKVFRHISLFIAPSETEQQQPQTRTIRVPGGGDKNVQIIFVKAPSTSTSQQTEVILPEQPQQKTLVYVLMKKQEANGNNLKIRGPSPTKPSPPEVYFIKYKKGSDGQGGGQSTGGYSSPNSFGTPSFSSSISGGSSNGGGFVPVRNSGAYSSNYGAPL